MKTRSPAYRFRVHGQRVEPRKLSRCLRLCVLGVVLAGCERDHESVMTEADVQMQIADIHQALTSGSSDEFAAYFDRPPTEKELYNRTPGSAEIAREYFEFNRLFSVI